MWSSEQQDGRGHQILPFPLLTHKLSEISQLCLVSLVSTHSQNERWLYVLGLHPKISEFKVLGISWSP